LILGLQLECRLDASQLLLKVTDFRSLFLHFVQQHRREFVIPHAVDAAILVSNYQLGVDLCDFLGN
jgi:hypothetical protein